MPKKPKQEQELDIVEIDEEVNPYENNEVEEQYEEAPIEIKKQTKPKKDKYAGMSEARLAALAKGREVARLNREKKKLEFEQKLKDQLKEEMKQMLKQDNRNLSQSPPPRKSKPQESVQRKQRSPSQSPPPRKSKPQESVQRKQRSPSQSPPQKKPSKTEEAKKIVEKSKKQMPFFKDEEKKIERKGRMVDFFKPKKVIYVSDDE